MTPTLSEISWFCQLKLNNSFHKLSEERPEACNRKLRYEFQSMHQWLSLTIKLNAICFCRCFNLRLEEHRR